MLVLLVVLCTSCTAVSELGGGSRVPPPEYRQKVGLVVDDKVERFHFYGSATGDASNWMSFHLQQTLPARIEGVLRQMFDGVEVREPGPDVRFKSPDLAGYFSVKTLNVRYDYPDSGLTLYRAEVEMLVEFRTMDDEPVWSSYVQGEGVGYSDKNYRLSDFSRGASSALEDAFEAGVDEIETQVYKAASLRQYFRARSSGP